MPVNMTEWSMKLADERANSILNAPAGQNSLDEIRSAMEWNAMRRGMRNNPQVLKEESQTEREKRLSEMLSNTAQGGTEEIKLNMLETPVSGIIGYSTDNNKSVFKRTKRGRKPKPVENPNPFELSMMTYGLGDRWLSMAYQGITPTNKALKQYRGTPLNGHAAILAKGVKRPSMAGLLNMVYYGGKLGAQFMDTALKNGGEAFIKGLSIKAGRKPSNNVESLDRDIPYGSSKGWIFVNDLAGLKNEQRFAAVMGHLRALISIHLEPKTKTVQQNLSL